MMIEKYVICYYGEVIIEFNTGFATYSKVNLGTQIISETIPKSTYPTEHAIESHAPDKPFEYAKVEKRYYSCK